MLITAYKDIGRNTLLVYRENSYTKYYNIIIL
jgi:hypothetical protein